MCLSIIFLIKDRTYYNTSRSECSLEGKIKVTNTSLFLAFYYDGFIGGICLAGVSIETSIWLIVEFAEDLERSAVI